MVLSGDVPSNCSLGSFRHARFFDFFNEIAPNGSFKTTPLSRRIGGGNPTFSNVTGKREHRLRSRGERAGLFPG
jgi:hypothetical protein